MVKKLSKSLPKFIDLNTFEKRTLKIIKKYDAAAEYTSTGGHSRGRKIEFKNKDGLYKILRICEKQKGSESVISTGIFNSEVAKLAEATGIPAEYLAVYIKGSGKLYKKYIKKFEAEYEV
ncbi:hypothetical protein KY346_00315 [Candidatus Woesearchaeota archaeon]|nr:hypothetical protein [Candidatus Woesearchaeota archaeon]